MGPKKASDPILPSPPHDFVGSVDRVNYQKYFMVAGEKGSVIFLVAHTSAGCVGGVCAWDV